MKGVSSNVGRGAYAGPSCGLLSELVLVRMHGRADAYLHAPEGSRGAIVAACRREATVPDLAERILSRTVYAQAPSRVAPLRELVQNALDASPRGGRIDVRGVEGGEEITVVDRGRGMTRTELLEDLLVPFRSGKDGEPGVIGEHGIGFFSALELAAHVEVITVTRLGGHRLLIVPTGEGPPYPDFSWTIARLDESAGRLVHPTGTSVRVRLARPIPRATLAAELAVAVGMVDSSEARIYVDGALINTARARMRRVGHAPIALGPGSPSLGDLTLYAGRGEGIEPRLTIVQKGLRVSAPIDAFLGPDLALHRDLARAITAAGFGLIAELPLGVPLNKSRSAVAAHASAAVDAALIAAFERFVLCDALYDRELVRAVDHRLSSVLDRLVAAALLGEPAAASAVRADREPSSGAPARVPTVAAPEEVVRFASGLLDAPLFRSVVRAPPTRRTLTLRQLLNAHRAGVLRAVQTDAELPARSEPGLIHLALDEPLAQALWRRLTTDPAAQPGVQARLGRPGGHATMLRTTRDTLLARAGHVPGVRALAAVMEVLQRIDAAISHAAELEPTPIWAHQDLYGPDEMAHTDGSGISVNLASSRMRALLSALLADDDEAAFSAVVDLLLHEKAHVSLATYVPRREAEHGTSFYRRKEWLRRRLLHALCTGAIADPIRWLRVARRSLEGTHVALPPPELLARALDVQAAAA